MNEESKTDDSQDFLIKKMTPLFVDEIANISISPNGACRLNFATWRTDEEGNNVRVDTEIIMTTQSLKLLSESLPQALNQAQSALKARDNQSSKKTAVQ